MMQEMTLPTKPNHPPVCYTTCRRNFVKNHESSEC